MKKYLWEIWRRKVPEFCIAAILLWFACLSLSFSFRAGADGNFGFFFVLFLISGILGGLLIKECVTSHWDVAATMKEFGISPEDLEKDMENPLFHKYGVNIDIGHKYAIFYDKSNKNKPKLILLDRLIWAFPGHLIIDHKLYGVVPLYQTNEYKATLIDKDHNEYIVSSTSQETVREILELLHEKVPYMALGYEERLRDAYRLNFNEFVQEIENAKKQFQND